MYYNHFYRKDMPTAFSPLGGLSCPHKKKRKNVLGSSEIGKYQGIPKIFYDCSLVPSPPPKMNFFVNISEKLPKKEIELFS